MLLAKKVQKPLLLEQGVGTMGWICGNPFKDASVRFPCASGDGQRVFGEYLGLALHGEITDIHIGRR